MASQILLINFTDNESAKLSDLPVKVARGYISDVRATRSLGKTRYECLADYPPVYEHQITFIKLSMNEKLEAQYKGKATFQQHKDIIDFFKYWDGNGVLVLFVGDYSFSDLKNVGIFDIRLDAVHRAEKQLRCVMSKEEAPLTKFFNKVKPQVVMPPSKYVSVQGSWLQRKYGESEIRTIYQNFNDEPIGVLADSAAKYADDYAPQFIVLPMFTDIGGVSKSLVEEISRIYPKLVPEITDQDWLSSDEYYPREVAQVGSSIDALVKNTVEQVGKMKEDQAKLREKYKQVRGLLTDTGDELKQDVLFALNGILAIKADDADKLVTDGTLDEDVLVKLSGLNVLVEVKGTRRSSPPDTYITQVWKHLHRSNLTGAKEGALILNHDLQTKPEKRSDAYPNNDELSDIIFIDTRVLFRIVVDVLAGKLSNDEAANILFTKGRVTYSQAENIDPAKKKQDGKQ